MRDYAERCQGVVRAVLEPVNRFADLRPLTVLRSLARASVLAAREGDDYWSCPDKVQRQLEVLRAFPDASVVSHASIAIRDELIVRGPQGHPEGVIPRDELLSRTTMSPRTMCFRATYAEAPEWESRMPALEEGWRAVGLMPPVAESARRINARVGTMIEEGFVDEVRALRAQGDLGCQAAEAVGYRELARYLDRRCSLHEATEAIKVRTRRLARQQRTWLRRFSGIDGSMWFEPGPECGTADIAAHVVSSLSRA